MRFISAACESKLICTRKTSSKLSYQQCSRMALYYLLENLRNTVRDVWICRT